MAIGAIYGAEKDRLNQSLSASPQSVSPQHSVPLLNSLNFCHLPNQLCRWLTAWQRVELDTDVLFWGEYLMINASYADLDLG